MNSDASALLIFCALAIAAGFYLAFSARGQKIAYLTSELDHRSNRLREIEREVEILNENLRKSKKELETQSAIIAEERLVFSERTKLFPWLSRAFGDLEELRGKREEQELLKKRHPAAKAAETVKDYSKRVRELEQRSRQLTYRIDFFEKHFPWLTDLAGNSLEEYLADLESRQPQVQSANVDDDDPVKGFLSEAEFSRLTSSERNQLALDR